MVVLHRPLVEAADPDGQPFGHSTKLGLQKKGITDIALLGQCHHLQRLDLSHNNITSAQALRSCTSLRWLNLAHNSLADLDGLQDLTALNVLNVSHNSLSSIQAVTGLQALNALILSDNEITTLPSLEHLGRLNTLVVSSNLLSSLGGALSACSSLLKLSLSHNDVASLKGALCGCPALQELRCAHNSLKALPADLAGLGQLRIVDAGHNALRSWKSVQVLPDLPRLRQLNLMGNPLTTEDDYRAKLLELAPGVNVLDGRRIDRLPPGTSRAEPGVLDETLQRTEPSRRSDMEQDVSGEHSAGRQRKRGAGESDGDGSSDPAGGEGAASKQGKHKVGPVPEVRGAEKLNGRELKRPKKGASTLSGAREKTLVSTSAAVATGRGEDEIAAASLSKKNRPAKEEGEVLRKGKPDAKLSAKETGVLKVIVNPVKGSKKGKSKGQGGQPFRPDAELPGGPSEVDLGTGGPSSWG